MIRERENRPVAGLPVLLVLLVGAGLTIWGAVDAARNASPWL